MKKGILFVLLLQTLAVAAQLSMVKIAELPEKMHETSGLVLYKDKYLVTHNDGGNAAAIYLFDVKGNDHRTIEIEDAKNRDWEDLAQDDEGRLYIGDFGNNGNNRESCQIYILPKDFAEGDKTDSKKITFVYEDQKNFPPKKNELNFDCEAFFWKNDSLYIFTKCRTEPFSGVTNVYVIPDKAGDYVAKKIGSIQLCSSDWRFCSVTAADYSEKYNLVVLLTYSRIYLIGGFTGNQFWNGNLKSYQINLAKQREAICFKGKNSWYMTDEYRKGLGGGNLYEVKLKE